MKAAGLLLMPSGWIIALTALAILGSGPARGAFALAGVAVEMLGLALLARAHAPARKDDE